MLKNILLIVALLSFNLFALEYLPDERKGDWQKVGVFRNMNYPQIKKAVNIMDYAGANNTGSYESDNYTALLNAISDVENSDYGLIFFPPGSYIFKKDLEIKEKSKIIIRGSGADKTSLDFALNKENDKISLFILKSTQIGLENFCIKRKDKAKRGTNIYFYLSKMAWVSGVDSYKPSSIHIVLGESENIEVRGSYLHKSYYNGTGGNGYGVVCENSKYCLTENNIFRYLRHSMIIGTGSKSNVFGYNYSRQPRTSETYLGVNNWPADMCLHGHSSSDIAPAKNLFEGNKGAFITCDDAHGENGKYNTFLRNRATYYGIKIESSSPYQNIIANEFDDKDRDKLIPDWYWDAIDIEGNNHYLKGNTDYDQDPTAYPSENEISGDLSFYLNPDSLPDFLKDIEYFPPFGVVDSDHLGKNSIPAKDRYDNDELPKTVKMKVPSCYGRVLLEDSEDLDQKVEVLFFNQEIAIVDTVLTDSLGYYQALISPGLYTRIIRDLANNYLPDTLTNINITSKSYPTIFPAITLSNNQAGSLTVNSLNPDSFNIQLEETDSINFNISAQSNSEINFLWQKNGILVSNDSSYNYQTNYYSSGKDSVTLKVNSANDSLSYTWLVQILEKNRPITIINYQPTDSLLNLVALPDTILFHLETFDPDTDQVPSYTWFLDNDTLNSSANSLEYIFTDSLNCRLKVLTSDGFSQDSLSWKISSSNTAVKEINEIENRLYQNYPNPFNPATTIKFNLKNNALVKINIFNMKGAKIQQIDLGQQTKGEHQLRLNYNFSKYASGYYYYQLSINNNIIKTRKMLFIK